MRVACSWCVFTESLCKGLVQCTNRVSEIHVVQCTPSVRRSYYKAKCNDGVEVLCRSHLAWLVYEGSIPTACTCFHSENVFVTFWGFRPYMRLLSFRKRFCDLLRVLSCMCLFSFRQLFIWLFVMGLACCAFPGKESICLKLLKLKRKRTYSPEKLSA